MFPVRLVSSAFGTYLFPKASRLQSDLAAVRRHYLENMAVLLSLVLPLTVAAAILAPSSSLLFFRQSVGVGGVAHSNPQRHRPGRRLLPGGGGTGEGNEPAGMGNPVVCAVYDGSLRRTLVRRSGGFGRHSARVCCRTSWPSSPLHSPWRQSCRAPLARAVRAMVAQRGGLARPCGSHLGHPPDQSAWSLRQRLDSTRPGRGRLRHGAHGIGPAGGQNTRKACPTDSPGARR